MTTETNPQEEAQRIWDEMDKADAGQPAPEPVEVPTEATPEVTAEEAATPAQEEQPQEQPAATDDDPKVLREKLAGMEAIQQQLLTRLRNAEGHIGGLSSQLKAQIEAAKAVQATGGDAPTAKEIRDAQGNPEALKKLSADYPEFAQAIAPSFDAVNQRVAALEARLQQPAQSAPDVTQEINKLRAELTVEARHQGWQQEVRKPEFQGWLTKSPREVQMLAASAEPADAVRLLDLWKESRKPPVTQQAKGISAAAALPAGRASAVRQKPIEQMTEQEYWAYLDEREKQKG